MKTRLVLVLGIVAILALTGCNSEKSITGTAGMRQVSGKVVTVGDIQGASPAGIEVRARGLGIVSSTDANGAFALTGLPDGAVELNFSRASDGIDASLNLQPGVNSVTVQLQSKSASASSGGNPLIQLEGLITEISSSSITVMDASRKVDVVCAIIETTTIRKGDRTLTTDDLEVGDRVHVTARLNSDDTYTAVEIKLQEEGDDDSPGEEPTKRELEGLVLAIDAASITVQDASTGEQTAAIDASTIIRKGGTPLTTNDIKIGYRVHVRAKIEDDSSLTALEIIVQNTN